MTDYREQLKQIRTFPSLVRFLRDELDWPVETEDFEELTFDYEPEELGIDAANAAKIEEIKRLRPLVANQPWGIFFVKFEPKQLPVVALRRILAGVVVKKRATASAAEQPKWAEDDLLFISNYGEGDERKISFAHFSKDPAKNDLPTLKVIAWDELDTPLHLEHTANLLVERLSWPSSETEWDDETWRERWRSAFELKHKEVITTSKALAERLAELARRIRGEILRVLEIETEDGKVTQLMKAFQESLVHDLDADGFADMYAQTIAYGLLSARIADPEADTADDLTLHMRTNPFLRELMETFLHVGGRRGASGGTGIDFDELGVSDVVQLLDDAKMEAVVLDFGDKNPLEDPVIHFYELFLKEYDAKKRMQRGVFYTPRPVVSYIVRSVDELLRTEFGLEAGLADTTTWGEMTERHADLEIPEGVSPEQDFVQILDPATGTGTFLVEVIDLVHKTLVSRWKAHGHTEIEIEALWNEYVPKHLLSRLHGYELLMAPYAIAHLKVGLKLYETGYHFGSDERARIYLTNALEPPHDFSGQFEFAIPALAHEAQAVSEIKQRKRFTVVIGNPPYSNYGQLNRIPFILGLLEDYKRELVEKKLNLDDDFIKFIRFSQHLLDTTGVGLFGMITNNSFLDGLTHRQMRCSLGESYQSLLILNLHGSATLGETSPDGSHDENVFDIRQGVGVTFCVKHVAPLDSVPSVLYRDLWGLREHKYRTLGRMLVGKTLSTKLPFAPPHFFFVSKDFSHQSEYDSYWKLTDVFQLNQTGIKTDRDELFFDFEKHRLEERIKRFYSADGLEEPFRTEFRIEDSSSYRLLARRSATTFDSSNIVQCVYRPFDKRWLYYSPLLTSRPGYRVMRHMMSGRNLGLVTLRINGGGDDFVAICTDSVVEKGSLPRGNYSLFPLFVDDEGQTVQSAFHSDTGRQHGFTSAFLDELSDCLKLEKGGDGFPADLTPESIFHFAYAVCYSGGYRSRYEEFLRIDFPRLPLTENMALFRALALLGNELVALHLMQSPKLDKFITGYTGARSPEVGRVGWSDETIWLDAPATRRDQPAAPGTIGFRGVPEPVWNFHIGGYQVCHKWLKDRKGRTLSDDDIAHYQKIVVALSETIRLMKEIDEVIDEHGGWPGAFVTTATEGTG